MIPRRARRLLKEPLALPLIAVAVAGALLGTSCASMQPDDTAAPLFGKAWRTTPDDARAVLVTLFGLQITALTIVLSVNATTIQAAANQYSPRLVPFYLRSAPLRRALPIFALSGAYIVAATRALGLLDDAAIRPRPVISGAFLLLFAAFMLLMVEVLRTFRFMRVERVLALVRESTLGAAKRAAAALDGLRCDEETSFVPAPRASPFLAPISGYLVEIDARALVRSAREAGVRVLSCRTVGEFVDRGEILGWAASDANAAVPTELARSLATSMSIEPTREPDCDPAYGLRILADVATRALSSSTNDPYTARQALQQIRSVLRYVAQKPLGNWHVIDDDGTTRASLQMPSFAELVSLAIDGPLRTGAGDPEVLDGVLEIALEVGLVARRAKDRAIGQELVTRVLHDAVQYGRIDALRLARLRDEARSIRAALEQNSRCMERLTLTDWALPRGEPRFQETSS